MGPRVPAIFQLIFYAAALCSSAVVVVADDDAAVNTDLCYRSMMEADMDNDRKLTKSEYVSFLKLYGLPGIEQDDEYQDIKLVLQSTFIFLSCICTTNGSSTTSCCAGDPYLPNDGAADFETPTAQQELYLSKLCSLTGSAIDQATPATPPPTLAPTTSQSNAPTESPSSRPSQPLSTTPSSRPSLAVSTPTTSTSPTTVPATPTPSATGAVDAFVRTTYSISVLNGQRDDIPPASYTPDLIGAMDFVATEASYKAEEQLGSGDRRLQDDRPIKPALPTSILLIEDSKWADDSILGASSDAKECPAKFGNPELDSCKTVTVSIGLFLDEGQNKTVLSNVFKSALEAEIADGRLQQGLSYANPDSKVQILVADDDEGPNGGDDKNPPGLEADDGNLSTGAIVGLGAAGVLMASIVGMLVVSSKKKQIQRQDDGKFVEATPSEELKLAQGTSVGAVVVGSGLEWEAKSHDEESPPIGTNPWTAKGGKDNASEVSQEDSAGWSDAYSSSMGTNESGDDQNLDVDLPGNEAGMGVANLEELEDAITAGNWAAVGASAALLAASQYETDSLGNSKTSTSVYSNEDSSAAPSLNKRALDNEKTKELDDLIQTGDWAGVIQAAARFESEVASTDEQSAMVFEDSDSRSDSHSRTDSKSGSITSGSYFSNSFNNQTTSTASGAQPWTGSQEEYRKEVYDLVTKVVPEELDHVDDMIGQFKGRENELIETLRTMQEREIAQKAKKAEQQKAKMNAKKTVRDAQKAKASSENEDDDAAAAAAADWAIARSLASLEKKEEESEEEQGGATEDVPKDEGADDEEGSL